MHGANLVLSGWNQELDDTDTEFFFYFNEKKTEVMVFGPLGTCRSHSVDLAPVTSYLI